jgi:PAS domain S-box-containing protein
MTEAWPDSALPPSAEMERTLAALDRARQDPALAADTRSLLDQAHAALRAAIDDTESERLRYTALFDAVPDPVSILAWDGTVLDLNKAGLAAYKRPREEIVGQPIEVLNPDLPKDHMVPVWEALNRGETYAVEVANMRGDGSRFPVEVHTAGFDYKGKKCMVAVARDLSKRWQAETRYRLLLESIDVGVILFDRDMHVISGNPAAHRAMGAEPGQSVHTLLRPEHWKVVDARGRPLSFREWPTNQALERARVISNTIVGLYYIPKRRMSWISVTTVPVFEADGTAPQYVFAMFSDVTTLKRDNVLFDRAQGLAHIGGWEWDRGRKRLYLTREAQKILGRSPTPETIDDMLAGVYGPDQHRIRNAMDRLIETGGSFDLELQYLRSDHHTCWVRVIGEADTGDPGTSRLVGTLQDITERKHSEETLRVQARTDPLTGLLNRDAILVELDIRMQDPTHAAVAVLYVDLDRFKVINDVLGHSAGDELLASAAQRIASAVGTEGLVARFGGDEFLVVCNIADDEQRPERIAGAILHHREHRHRPCARRRRAPAGSDPERRCGDVRQQASFAQRMAGVHARTRADPGRQALDGNPSAPRRGQRRIPSRLPAAGRSAQRSHRRRRSADPLAEPSARRTAAGSLHQPCRDHRRHRAHRQLGAARSLPPSGGVA